MFGFSVFGRVICGLKMLVRYMFKQLVLAPPLEKGRLGGIAFVSF